MVAAVCISWDEAESALARRDKRASTHQHKGTALSAVSSGAPSAEQNVKSAGSPDSSVELSLK